jgi:glutamine amidotransferase
MTIVLIDYGVGNLRSVKKALEFVGANVIQTDDTRKILGASKVVLPGVGAFQDGMNGLNKRNLTEILRRISSKGIPLLGICLGLQLLYDISSELGNAIGLGMLNGEVYQFPENELKVPHTGWNQLRISGDSPLLRGVQNNSYVYFNHSYYCAPQDSNTIIAHTDYGIVFPAAVHKDSIYGVQFHPEKSQDIGLQILRNFVEVCQ